MSDERDPQDVAPAAQTAWWSTPPTRPSQSLDPTHAEAIALSEAPYSAAPLPLRTKRPRRNRRRQARHRIGLVTALIIALVAGMAGGTVGFFAAEQGSLFDADSSLGRVTSAIERPPGSIAGIAQRTLPSVVSISTRGSNGGGTGSGFVIRSDGYILTNNHVIDSAAESGGNISVQFQNGRSFRATVVGRDAAYDLAVLKIPVTGLTALPLGDSDEVVVGDSVIAVGAPLGLAGTVTSGIVSAKNRAVTAGGSGGGESAFINAIQTDAAINPGNSGGPLVNLTGAVIGVNSAIATLGSSFGGSTGSIGLGFAIPINQARRTADELIRTGRSTYPIIGVSLDRAYAGEGARIATGGLDGAESVIPGGPADRAGLQPGDVILAIDGTQVSSADELIVAIRSRQPGDVVVLTFRRGEGDVQRVRVRLRAADRD
jgi:putative serine protease PepD